MRWPRCCSVPKSAMPPDQGGAPDDAPTGLDAHLRALEHLYGSAPINRFFASTLTLPEAGHSREASEPSGGPGPSSLPSSRAAQG